MFVWFSAFAIPAVPDGLRYVFLQRDGRLGRFLACVSLFVWDVRPLGPFVEFVVFGNSRRLDSVGRFVYA